MGCTRRKTAPTGTPMLPTEDQTHTQPRTYTHTHTLQQKCLFMFMALKPASQPLCALSHHRESDLIYRWCLDRSLLLWLFRCYPQWNGVDAVILKTTTTRSDKNHEEDDKATKDDKDGWLHGSAASICRIVRVIVFSRFGKIWVRRR